MLGKKILAGLFAVLILVKLLVWFTSPDKWLGLMTVFLGHSGIVLGVYAVLIVITGYYVFSSMDLIDVALVMFLTALLMGITLIPYLDAFLKMREEIVAVGWGKIWYAVVIWGALALAVLHRVWAAKKR